ncbi:hypothetical protein FRD01_22290 [Microvenator marinus]|uniref:Uncharacterized protein n=1 Tax=Microvenator marinus TaxID=2600177 RepID=A0A5B8XWU9_9DELT|nr:hypothetical protein [Microvenator marinus]QED29914.1 hypothetical protein FRD01_22290 [Microvenator marinus]
MDGVQVFKKDRRSFEIRHFFDLPAAGNKAAWSIEYFFFFPRNIGITPTTWETTNFYRSTQVLMRLQSHGLTLQELADLSDLHNPGHILLSQVPSLLSDEPANGAAMTAMAQLFGAEIADALQEEIHSIRRRMSDRASLKARIERLCVGTEAALSALTTLRRSVEPYRTVTHPDLMPTLFFAEEYLLALADERFSELALTIKEAPSIYDGDGLALKLQLRLAQTLRRLHERQRSLGFVTVGRHAGEHYGYRLSLLKKELQKSLYLDMRASTKDPFVANSAAMVAAGLAATWATIAQVPLLTGALGSSQGAFFLALAVGAYVLKDRIKDHVRQRLIKQWLKWDHNVSLGDHLFHLMGLSEVSGRAMEKATWKTVREVPRDVVRLRRAARTVRGSSTELENVIHYKRRIELDGIETASMDTQFGIQEIVRVSLNDVMSRLDDQIDLVSHWDVRTGSFQRTELPKVYHLNLVYQVKQEGAEETVMRRARIVLNREEILRIEHVE